MCKTLTLFKRERNGGRKAGKKGGRGRWRERRNKDKKKGRDGREGGC